MTNCFKFVPHLLTMSFATPAILNEIAQELDLGFRAFIHKETGQLVFIPDLMNYPDIEIEAWKEETALLEKHPSDFEEICKWESWEAFRVMEAFVNEVSGDRRLQIRLLDALEGKKPFSRFKYVIDNSGPYRQQWFDFKHQRMMEYVAQQLEALAFKPGQ
ncbi:UPF0158 family protein [Flavihumibacter rivuli]|uniref:UPF0158 family protein n=1 Tax=Flavihumibacter rivuli TaxID=2838156 RepID=UPI001BDE898A|nr:UPF0158 family protein [Flavihumibacter rivuli]ULQ55821.1 UPF0158 family protein [Flavihumibacter rivuli]